MIDPLVQPSGSQAWPVGLPRSRWLNIALAAGVVAIQVAMLFLKPFGNSAAAGTLCGLFGAVGIWLACGKPHVLVRLAAALVTVPAMYLVFEWSFRQNLDGRYPAATAILVAEVAAVVATCEWLARTRCTIPQARFTVVGVLCGIAAVAILQASLWISGREAGTRGEPLGQLAFVLGWTAALGATLLVPAVVVLWSTRERNRVYASLLTIALGWATSIPLWCVFSREEPESWMLAAGFSVTTMVLNAWVLGWPATLLHDKRPVQSNGEVSEAGLRAGDPEGRALTVDGTYRARGLPSDVYAAFFVAIEAYALVSGGHAFGWVDPIKLGLSLGVASSLGLLLAAGRSILLARHAFAVSLMLPLGVLTARIHFGRGWEQMTVFMAGVLSAVPLLVALCESRQPHARWRRGQFSIGSLLCWSTFVAGLLTLLNLGWQGSQLNPRTATFLATAYVAGLVIGSVALVPMMCVLWVTRRNANRLEASLLAALASYGPPALLVALTGQLAGDPLYLLNAFGLWTVTFLLNAWLIGWPAAEQSEG